MIDYISLDVWTVLACMIGGIVLYCWGSAAVAEIDDTSQR